MWNQRTINKEKQHYGKKVGLAGNPAGLTFLGWKEEHGEIVGFC